MSEQSRGVRPRNKTATPRGAATATAAARLVDCGTEGGALRRHHCVAELSENLGALHSLLKQLAEQADAKLAAMRAADARVLQLCTARESELLQQVARNAQERQAVLARVAQHLPPPLPSGMQLSELIERFPEPQASILRARSVALRESAGQLQEKNRLAARVAHHLQMHIRAVFAELAKVNQESVVYGPKGQHEQAALRSCLDAVG